MPAPADGLPSLSAIHDDLFWCLQFAGERIALLRAIINEQGEDGYLKVRLQEEMERADRLANFAVTIFRLVPKEAAFHDLIGQLIERGYMRHAERG